MLAAANLMGPHIVATKLNETLDVQVHNIEDETVMLAQLMGELEDLDTMVDTLRSQIRGQATLWLGVTTHYHSRDASSAPFH